MWIRIGCACGVALLLVTVLAACGRTTGLEEFQASDDEAPPATAGSLEALVGTTWKLSQGQTLTFEENGQGVAGRPGGLPMNMKYELDPDGVITVIIPGASRSGTWDGTTLIIGGETLQPVSPQADS